MAKEEPMAEITKGLADKKIVIGQDTTIKNLKNGRIKKIFVAQNCSEKTKKELAHYAGIEKIELVELPHPNEELGIRCKKQFSISVLGLLK